MQTRWLVLIVLALAVAAGGYFFFNGGLGGTALTEKYQSSTQGIRFAYPSNYELVQERERDVERPWHVIVLADQDSLPAPQNGEGPPVIAIVIYENVAKQSLEDWVRSSSFSNFQLSGTGELSSTTVAGEEAIKYTYSGLYETEAIATVKGDKIYLFSVGWIDSGDRIRKDFTRVLESVEFI